MSAIAPAFLYLTGLRAISSAEIDRAASLALPLLGITQEAGYAASEAHAAATLVAAIFRRHGFGIRAAPFDAGEAGK
jgi:hypothetical protein